MSSQRTTSSLRRARGASRRGFATALVLWAVALAVLILSAVQMSAWRQAAQGREALARTRAYWAARSAVETVIARLEQEATQAQPFGARSLMDSLAIDAQGDLSGATYRTRHETETGVVSGPADAQAKLNINTLTYDDLMLMPDMTEDVAYSILDYIDADEEPNMLGAEAESYYSLPIPYLPRNAPIRHLQELELVIGVRPEWVRGEDWNLNGLLDPNENDDDASWPPDNNDGILDAGWSAIVGCGGAFGGVSPTTGEAKIDLSTETASAVAAAISCDDTQSEAIINHIKAGATSLGNFIKTNLSTIAQQDQQSQNQSSALGQMANSARGGAGRAPRVANLSREQLAALLATCTVGDPALVYTGKVNINTATDKTLEYLSSLTPTTRDAILLFRDQAAGDMQSITELLDVPQVTPAILADLYEKFDVRTNVISMTVQGRDNASGLTVEIYVEIDRSTLPATVRTVLVR